ncbi:hypothetical protein M569_15574 [Genlisea aurea]|uniref:Uncharacterized protein n=1 Tax=Genlisea aurea TaxID=192259 RepID=S8C487_9LAMI|nr:hypothetical protein M569_15574 [Genlisea aurea]
MSQSKVLGSPSLQMVKSLSSDFRLIADSIEDRAMFPGAASENVVEVSREDLEDDVVHNGVGDGLFNDESPYSSLDMSSKDESSSGDRSSTLVRPAMQSSRVDSKWSDTTPYLKKKVKGCLLCFLCS